MDGFILKATLKIFQFLPLTALHLQETSTCHFKNQTNDIYILRNTSVTGNLFCNLKEEGSNKGDLSGTLNGNTLVAD
jgi:hypothetical protein